VNKGFDGVFDTEDWTTYFDYSVQVAYWNEEYVALHNIGKPLYVFSGPYEYGSLYVDYEATGQGEWYQLPFSHDNLVYMFYTYDPVMTGPYILDLAAGDYNCGYPSLSGQLDHVTQFLSTHGGWSAYPKWKGIAIYWTLSMTDDDWNAWINWQQKGENLRLTKVA
jgi:hypothetical protein